ncbi:MAG TPA: hypothetical protein VGK59_03360 [Ohtaekwangia sp.]
MSTGFSLNQIPFSRILFIIISINFLSRFILVLRPLPYLDGIMIPDDAYLSLHLARSIGDGNGPWYDDVYTNGFQPLYVFLMAPVFALSNDQVEGPVKIALLLLSLFDTAALAVLMLWIKKMTSSVVAGIASLIWIFNDYIIPTTLNGLETIIATFFIVWASYYFYLIYYEKPERKNHHFLILGIIAGFACLTRVDSLIFAFIVGVFILFKEFADKKQLIIRASFYGVSALAIFSIWVIYSMYYTGLWYPESGKAVRLISLTHANFQTDLGFFKKIFWHAGAMIWRGNGYLIIMIILMMVFVLRKKLFTLTLVRSFSPLILFFSIMFFAYTCYIFTSWYFSRYFFPFTVLFILLFAVLLDVILRHSSGTLRKLAIPLVLLLWFVPLFVRGNFIHYYTGEPDNTLGYRNMALWANDNFPKGTVIGSSQSGALGYFCPDLKVVNLDGVVNGECYQYLIEERNMEYIRKRKIEYVVGWYNNIDFIKLRTQNFKESDLQLVKKIESFQSWQHHWYVYTVAP